MPRPNEVAAYKPQCKNWWTWFAFIGRGIIECSLELKAQLADEDRIKHGGGKGKGRRKGEGTNGAHVDIITRD